MQRIVLSLIILMFLTHTAIAHDGSDHASELEQWVSGIGIILILLATLYRFWWKRPAINHDSHFDDTILNSDQTNHKP